MGLRFVIGKYEIKIKRRLKNLKRSGTKLALRVRNAGKRKSDLK